MTLTFEEKYQAIINKDSRYEGLFITAVKTTGIFCRPVCTARKPRAENVEFYNSPWEALEHGYRPCKVCKPMQAFGKLPTQVEQILRQITINPEAKVKDKDLKSKGLEPSTIRRWFQKNYGMTFQAYQRKIRMNAAYIRLNSGRTVTHTAYDIGFDSISGFSNSFQKAFELSPSKVIDQAVLNMVRLTTPLGPMIACATQDGICLLEFADRNGLKANVQRLAQLIKSVLLPGSNQHLAHLQQQLTDYFQGRRKEFNLKLSPVGTSFQKRVWASLVKIPYGVTHYYAQQADLLGQPKAVRAVARANAQNRIAIVIPCHRVIGKDGNLRGYGAGLNRKKWLLEHEGLL